MPVNKKQKGLSEEQIGTIVDRKVRQAIGLSESKLSREREKVSTYYNGEAPKPQHKGQSTYVSTDVYDAVEAAKADLLETFGGSQDIGQFEPEGPDDVEACRIATDYASYVIYRQNDGFAIFDSVIQDGLKARVGLVKVYWHDEKEHQDEEFDGLDEATVHGLTALDDVEDLEAEPDETGLYRGKLTRVVRDQSRVVIEPIAPENFGISPQAKRLKDAFHYHLELMTKDELKAQGIDVSKLADIPPDADENVDRSTETDERFRQVDTGFTPDDEEDQEELKRYKVYECYTRLQKHPGDRVRLYKVVLVSKKVLLCEEVDRSPFIAYVPLRIAHSFWGNSFAARVIPTQNARTVLTRGILDHTVVTTNPRYTVLQGGLTNPRELLDNRLGGLVNITRPDALAPLQQSNLNPFVFQTIEMLKSNAEQTTGISSLAQGLNKDAVSSQNSQGMVADLVDLSKQRAKVMARNFALFLQELYVEVYRLVVENEDKASVVELAGNWVEVDPRRWIARKAFRVNFHLGTSAAEKEAAKFVEMLAMGSQDPEIGRMVQAENKYNIATHILRLRGIRNLADVITHPSKIPPPEPPPEFQLKMKELEGKAAEHQAKAEQAKIAAQVRMAELQHDLTLKQLEVRHKEIELTLKVREQERKETETANKIDVSQREVAIEEKAPIVESVKAIASANS
jgi:hypothetical protein